MAVKPAVKLPNVGPVKFIREVRAELAKVTWPSREATIKLTGVVIGVSIAVGLFIGGLDIALLNISKVFFK